MNKESIMFSRKQEGIRSRTKSALRHDFKLLVQTNSNRVTPMQLGDGHGGNLESSLLNDSFSRRNMIIEHDNQLNGSMEWI